MALIVSPIQAGVLPMNADNVSYREVLAYWFAPANRHLWFRSTPALDAALQQRFGATWDAARQGKHNDWQREAHGALALVIVLDQFPLNMFRGSAKAFATEAQALGVAGHAIEQGWDVGLTDEEKAFLYMPFMHSEALADQERAVVLFSAAGLENNLRYARHHRELIRRFGRFPHRNAILGRPSTPEELAYLRSREAFLG